MRVFATGATGFVGPAIVRQLLERGHEVTVLEHRSRGPFRKDEGVAVRHGDVTSPASLQGALDGHDAVVHLVAIRRGRPADFQRLHTEATRNLLDASKQAGVRRFLYMSAEGVERERTPYEHTKMESERMVKASGLDWTIFRPTFITGPAEADAGGFDHEFAAMLRRGAVMPNFDGGRFKVQPVAKADVARAFAVAVDRPEAVLKTYGLAGPDVLTWKEYLRALGDMVGRNPRLVPAPKWLVLPMAGVFGGFSWFPASRDELVMLIGDHAEDSSAAQADLGLTLTPWRSALEEALRHPPAAPAQRRAEGGRPRAA